MPKMVKRIKLDSESTGTTGAIPGIAIWGK
jgi:hypothetical protein